MHIPQHMLQGNICPVTLAVGVASTAAALYFTTKSQDEVSPARFASVTALIFGLQMINFPVANGTSGHLIGGVLAAALLGVPRAILSIVLVLLAQVLFFGDGGLDAFGANILNMAIIGAGVGGIGMLMLKRLRISQPVLIFMASASSVVLASLACTVEVTSSNQIGFTTMAQAMIPLHALIGIGEGVLSVAVFYLCSATLKEQSNILPLSMRALLLMSAVAFVTPFASSFPDGLEHTIDLTQIISTGNTSFLALLNDYQTPGVTNPFCSTIIAAMLGMGIVYIFSMAVIRVRYAYDHG